MAKSKQGRKSPPALTVEERENRIISAAMDLAERQILEGTASAQVITHYLRLGSARERLERDMLEEKVRLLEAKTSAINEARKSAEMYEKAIEAMRQYGPSDDYDYDD